MNGSFQPVWLRIVVIGAAVLGVVLAWALFGVLASTGG